MRWLALVAVALAAAGCGGAKSRWPDCLRTVGVRHVRIATPHDLVQSPKAFAPTRAAALDYRDGHQATLVVSRTEAAAAKVALAFGSIPLPINLPGAQQPGRDSAVVRRGRTVLQWFGRRDPDRERLLLDCAAA